jgi:hypothetical protein
LETRSRQPGEIRRRKRKMREETSSREIGMRKRRKFMIL